MSFSHTITQSISSILTVNHYPLIDFSLDHPVESAHGDYASNVAMLLFPEIKENNSQFNSPRHLADWIKSELVKNASLNNLVERIEVAGPGFINFYLKTTELVKELEQITSKGDQYGTNNHLAGKKILTEFTDPNPFKEFHIGHLYSNTVGESLSRILIACKATLKRANYQGDVGMHVAKSLWGLKQKLSQDEKQLSDLDDLTIKDKVTYLGQAYALGATAYEENETAKAEMKQINSLVYQQDPEITDIYQRGRKWSLDYFETIYERLGTKFDYYFFESRVGPLGLQFVKEQLAKGVFEKSDKAIVFKGEKYGLHTRVFVNAQDLPTYEAKDLGLSVIKYEQYPYDLSIIITANEIDEYFKVVLKALSLIRPDLEAKTKHLSHGMVKLPEGKMSSRTGKIVTGEHLLEEVKARSLDIMKQNKSDYSEQELDEISEQVAVGAIKYAFLKSALGKDIIYDINSSLSLSGNSGPYIQYTYARCKSVLEKSLQLRDNSLQKQNCRENETAGDSLTVTWNLSPGTLNFEEQTLLRYLYRFPEVVAQAGTDFAPHLICTYLYELAQKYNAFYNKHSILGREQVTSDKVTEKLSHKQIPHLTIEPLSNKTLNTIPQLTTNNLQPTTNFRLSLTSATAQILRNGLNLLGIQAPQRM